MPGWRWLGGFWTAIVVLAAAGLTTLQALGPPVVAPSLPRTSVVAAPAPSGVHEAGVHEAGVHVADAAVPPAREPHGPEPLAEAATAPTPAHGPAPAQSPAPAPLPGVAGPIPALMEASSAVAPAQLPRIAADGRVSRIVYAAPVPVNPAGLARVALLFSGFGLSDRESRAAIDGLPGPASFAVSAYASDAGPLLTAAREAGHELLASIPMEPQAYPGNDEGSRSLLTGASPAQNATNLQWALSRTAGVVGATGASDGMRGERFADIPAEFDPVVAAVTARGLLYVDARPGRTAPPGTPVRAIDVVLDDQLGRAEMDARLQSLERTAKERGSAIGLVGALRPSTIERIAAWSKTLPGHGLVLVPVSAVVNP